MSKGNALQRITRVRTSLLLNSPFFGHLALRLRLKEAKYLPLAMTAHGALMMENSCAVDGKNFYYNPDFIDTLTDLELQAVVCHEVLHCAMGHPWRVGERNKMLANFAMDYAINPIVADAKMTLPKDALLDPKYKGMPFEQIYVKLLEQLPPNLKEEMKQMSQGMGGQGDQEGEDGGEEDGQGEEGDGKDGKGGKGKEKEGKDGKPKDGKGQGQQKDAQDKPQQGSGQQKKPGQGQGGGQAKRERWGGVVSAADQEDAKEQEAQWKVATIQAATEAKRQGNLPADLARLVDEAVRNKVDWKSALRRFMQSAAKNDYSWRMPSPRYSSQGLYLPHMHSETMPPVVVAIDTSGSIGQAELDSFAAELNSIISECKPEKTYVIFCDAAVANVQEFEVGDPIKLHPAGGGGTDFRPPFDWVKKQGIEPSCLIYMTDTFGTVGEAPEYPTLWAVTTPEKEMPWGETLYLGDDL